MRTTMRRAYRYGEPKRERGRKRRRLKRRFGLGRRELGAIGAGHLWAPEGFAAATRAAGFREPGPGVPR